MIAINLETTATMLSAIVGALSFAYTVWQGKMLRREKLFKQKLLSHFLLNQQYRSLRARALKYSKEGLKGEGLLWGMIFINVYLAIVLCIIRWKANSEGALSFFSIVVIVTLLNLLFTLLKKSSIPNVVLNLDELKSALNGSAWMLLCSLTICILVVLLSSNTPSSWYYPLSAIVASFGVVLEYIVFSSIIDTGTALLWRIYVSDSNSALAEKLPHLIVQTKTGNVFFGQLYDPLDDKLLILRKARLILHGNREVANTLGRVVSVPKKQENYLSIPWDEIEALQIVEDGLYKFPECSNGSSGRLRGPAEVLEDIRRTPLSEFFSS